MLVLGNSLLPVPVTHEVDMSLRIKILPEILTNKIAAGEVVERPASVVKELVENALDAGGAGILIEIEGGGKKLIKVSDDGCGMAREDALLALERHATSKIRQDEDLFNLTTLGFRGEALPSVASVSRLHLATRERETVEGTEIYAEGGRIKDVKSCGMAEGTVIAVRNLFFNTPARLKFMKSTETEAGHIGDLLTRLAISRPEVRFTYLSDSKTVFRLLPGDLRSRVAALLGIGIARELYPVCHQVANLSISGLVGRPDCSRSTGSHLYTYINGRFIRDRVVQHAVLQAYRTVLERGRYPVVVLFIELSSGEVDVNVHPTKHEVRFREQARVHDAIATAIEGVLAAAPWIQQEVRKGPAVAIPAPPSPTAAARVAEVREVLAAYQPSIPAAQHFPAPAPHGVPRAESLRPIVPEPSPPDSLGYFSRLSVIGQFNAAYILCQDDDLLVIIDQHAAHERVAFERLKRQYGGGGIEAQGLLFPATLELAFGEAASLREHVEEIHRLGYAVEPFGGTTWLVKEVPRLLGGADYARVLRDILAELQSLGRSRSFDDLLEALLTRIACHSVIRGRHALTAEEIRALFVQMDATGFAGNCPHGRPVFQTLSLAEIERMFKRL
jgi:DNA mismatch repair protein MutL